MDILCHLKANYLLKFTDFLQRLQNLCKCANLQTLQFTKEIQTFYRDLTNFLEVCKWFKFSCGSPRFKPIARMVLFEPLQFQPIRRRLTSRLVRVVCICSLYLGFILLYFPLTQHHSFFRNLPLYQFVFGLCLMVIVEGECFLCCCLYSTVNNCEQHTSIYSCIFFFL